MLDDSKCRMHNVILGNDFGEKAGLIADLTDQFITRTFPLMSALDGGHTPAVDERRNHKSADVREVNLPENDLKAIGDLRDEKEAVVNLLGEVKLLVTRHVSGKGFGTFDARWV